MDDRTTGERQVAEPKSEQMGAARTRSGARDRTEGLVHSGVKKEDGGRGDMA